MFTSTDFQMTIKAVKYDKKKKYRSKTETFECMTMSWSIGAQEDHTWRQKEDTEKKGRRERGKKGKEIKKIRSETQKYKSERLLVRGSKQKKKS